MRTVRTTSHLERVCARHRVGVVLDGRGDRAEALSVCRRLKADPYTAVTPVIFWAGARFGGTLVDAFRAGADEAIPETMAAEEQGARFRRALERADRDLAVHPTTRLPATIQIESDLERRIHRGQDFAACYVDLDHFKEFNDRYGYPAGDRVIKMTGELLREIVSSRTDDGFVGHIGGDDFEFHVPLAATDRVCAEVIRTFDETVRSFYTADDVHAGGFSGTDRRGNPFSVPIMTISIGVAWTRYRTFRYPGEVQRVLTEMKDHAKRQVGSLYLVDRRKTPVTPRPAATQPREGANV